MTGAHATPEDPEDVALAAASRSVDSVIKILRRGEVGRIRELFPPSLRSLVPPGALEEAWRTGLGDSPEAPDVGAPVLVRAGDDTFEAYVPVRTGAGSRTVVVTVTRTGALVGLRVVDHEIADWQPPDYADPTRFEEIEHVLGQAPMDTPATLSLPVSGRRIPGVVLLGGSGPVDRDATLWPYKPFKDLAWGLASRGIAVLRFAKISASHPRALARLDGLTVADEYLHHADLALALLRAQEDVDPSMIFVLGHSLGGTVAPRVVRRHPELAGMILLAAAATPLHWSLVRQVRQLSSATPDDPAADRAVATLVAQARLVDDPALSLSTPSALLPLALPASYWLDLRDYRATEVAAALPQPILLLQGGRDPQTTEADDLAAWGDALADRPDVEIRLLPDAGHLFLATTPAGPEQPPTPTTHLDEAVVGAVTDWIAGVTGLP